MVVFIPYNIFDTQNLKFIYMYLSIVKLWREYLTFFSGVKNHGNIRFIYLQIYNVCGPQILIYDLLENKFLKLRKLSQLYSFKDVQ